MRWTRLLLAAPALVAILLASGCKTPQPAEPMPPRGTEAYYQRLAGPGYEAQRLPDGNWRIVPVGTPPPLPPLPLTAAEADARAGRLLGLSLTDMRTEGVPETLIREWSENHRLLAKLWPDSVEQRQALGWMIRAGRDPAAGQPRVADLKVGMDAFREIFKTRVSREEWRGRMNAPGEWRVVPYTNRVGIAAWNLEPGDAGARAVFALAMRLSTEEFVRGLRTLGRVLTVAGSIFAVPQLKVAGKLAGLAADLDLRDSGGP